MKNRGDSQSAIGNLAQVVAVPNDIEVSDFVVEREKSDVRSANEDSITLTTNCFMVMEVIAHDPHHNKENGNRYN